MNYKFWLNEKNIIIVLHEMTDYYPVHFKNSVRKIVWKLYINTFFYKNIFFVKINYYFWYLNNKQHYLNF